MSPSSQSQDDSNEWAPRDICLAILLRSLIVVIVKLAAEGGEPSSSRPSLSPSTSSSCMRSPPPSSLALITFFFVSCWIFHACTARGHATAAIVRLVSCDRA